MSRDFILGEKKEDVSCGNGLDMMNNSFTLDTMN